MTSRSILKGAVLKKEITEKPRPDLVSNLGKVVAIRIVVPVGRHVLRNIEKLCFGREGNPSYHLIVLGKRLLVFWIGHLRSFWKERRIGECREQYVDPIGTRDRHHVSEISLEEQGGVYFQHVVRRYLSKGALWIRPVSFLSVGSIRFGSSGSACCIWT